MPSAKDYQTRILLDRYAKKNTDVDPKVGDMVVVSLTRKFERDGEEISSREIGIVTEVKKSTNTTYTVVLQDADKPEDKWEQIKGLHRNKIEVLEEKSYEDICARVADGIIKKNPEQTEFRDAVYTAMSNREFVPAGRILAGLGCDDRTLTFFNCYVFPPPKDSREGIAEHWKALFNTYSLGGGIGWDNSSLRPRGSIVHKVNGRSSGAVSWMEQFSQITGAVEQGGSRRGAALMSLWCWHPDIVEFIEAKAQREEFKVGDQTISRNKGLLENANVSVLISDSFMQAMERDDDWPLIFPDTEHPSYNQTWDGDIDKWIADEKPVVTHSVIKARDLWNRIIDRAWTSGEPGLLFMERMNKMSNSYYYDKLSCTNPCVTGDTPIFTRNGIITVDDLRAQQVLDAEIEIDHCEQTVRVKKSDYIAVQDARTAECIGRHAKMFFHTGKKPIYRVQTMEGYYVRCTADHRLLTASGWKRADELEDGDLLHVLCTNHGAFGSEGSEELGHVLGWLVADGHLTGEKAVLDFYDKKKPLAEFFANQTYKLVTGTEKKNRDYKITPVFVEERDKYTLTSERLYTLVREYGIDQSNLKRVPKVVMRGTEETQKAFLSALFTADGTFTDGNDKGASVRLDSTSPELLEEVQLLLLNFKIASKIYWNRREAGYRKLPDGKGGVAEYWCEAQHTLVISKINMTVFKECIDFMLPYKSEALALCLLRRTRKPYKETFTARFESITSDGEEDVYDTTVDYSHAYASGGLISHNCGEQSLAPNSVCNLGHINLSKLVRASAEQLPKKERTAEEALAAFDMERFINLISIGVTFLDTITDLNYYHDKEIEKKQLSERRIGLGVLGYGELLVRLGLRYGSAEALKFTDSLFAEFSFHSYNASADLATRRGTFPRFKADKFLQSGFVKQLVKAFPSLGEAVSKNGMRNVTLNTCAPTGSIGTMLDTTTGIEPYFLPSWVARSRIGTAEEEANILKEMHQKFGDAMPSYFVTTADISPEEHVRTQATIQKWIDASISKTVNMPNKATREDVARTYELMYKLGCKGGTVYRDGSRDRQVLYYKDEKTEKRPQPKEIPVEVVDEYKHAGFGVLRPKIDTGLGVTISKETPVGRLHATIRMHSKTGAPYDLFLISGKGDISADVQALGRLISVVLRWPDGEQIPQETRLEIIRDQLHRIPGRGQVGFGTDKVLSLPDGVAQVLNDYLSGNFPLSGIPMGEDQLKEFLDQMGNNKEQRQKLREYIINGADDEEEDPDDLAGFDEDTDSVGFDFDICPKCGNASYVHIPNKCPHCVVCTYTEC